MPYWDKNKIYTDVNGKPINSGDILRLVDEDKWCEPWRYQVCFEDEYGAYKAQFQVRDLNANNIGMCTVRSKEHGDWTGANGDVENIGHWTNHPGILSKDDLEHYFGIMLPEYHVGL